MDIFGPGTPAWELVDDTRERIAGLQAQGYDPAAVARYLGEALTVSPTPVEEDSGEGDHS